MSKFFKALSLAFLVLILIVIIVGLFLPTNYSVNRSIIIDAKPAAIHEYVGDLKKWPEWEPWTEQDPTIIITYGEKTSGIGANQSWIGKDGDGQLTLTSSSPAKGIEYDLLFDNGKYECKSAVVYEPMEEGQTKVTWSMDGNMNKPIIGGYFALIMDSMTGPMFERGLEKLKKQVER
jgi:ribosome-associated toxin RatA of RatAB toxin-antitoxin module